MSNQSPFFNRQQLEQQFSFQLTATPKAIDKRFIYSGQVTERQIHKRYGVIVSEAQRRCSPPTIAWILSFPVTF